MSSHEHQDSSENSLQKRVDEWLSKEGYPLEFATGATFRENGFYIRHGMHVRDPNTGAAREIDVVATSDTKTKNALLRISYIVECKWSRDKPWVVFASRSHRMAPSACISQMIGSEYGRAALWASAGDTVLQRTRTFSAPVSAGFGARQALNKGKDICYSALQSVVTLAQCSAVEYDRHQHSAVQLPEIAFIAFPLIVIDGQIFEASFNDDTGRVTTEPVESARIHWRGAESWRHFATVDIVRAEYLDEFVRTRYQELSDITAVLSRSCDNIADVFRTEDIRKLNVTRGPRGILGLPRLLAPFAGR